jgi:Ca-activated chloride channel homolog
VLVSDGQAWSGRVEEALNASKARGVPLYAVGVGTSAGGIIPAPATPATGDEDEDENPVFIHSALDRSSLRAIATAAGGYYFELDQTSDREIASTIINTARARAGSRGVEERTDDLYWQFLLLAAALLLAGVLFVRDPAELWIHIAGSGAVLLIVVRAIR